MTRLQKAKQVTYPLCWCHPPSINVYYWLLMPSAHGPIFCQIQLREKIVVNIWFFHLTVSVHMIRFLYRRQKNGPTLWFFIGMLFGTHSPNFLSELYFLWEWQVRSHYWITSFWFFIGLKLVHTIQFFIADKLLNGKVPFLSNWFSLRYNLSVR